MKTRVAIVGLLLSLFALLACAQDASKRPSPPAQAQCKFTDGKTVKTDYSSPRMKGRKIFGGLVPYGEVWLATGANEATTLVTDTNLTVEGKDVPAGSYTILPCLTRINGSSSSARRPESGAFPIRARATILPVRT